MRRLQTIVRMMVTVLVAVLFAQTFLAEGLLSRFVVSGASMSPAFHGAHYVLHCPECATVFRIETEDEASFPPKESLLRWGICPVCAFSQVPVPAGAWRPGDRICINRAALSLRAIRRWDVVLFRSPEDGSLTVKRVVGLPGETLVIRDGDIFINGQIAVKSLAVQRAMRIPVLYGRWGMQPGQTPEIYELAWHPIRNVPHNSSLVPHPSPLTPHNSQLNGVTNQLCENQWRIEPPDGIFPVRDLMLEFDWKPDDDMPLFVRTYADKHQLTPSLITSQNGTHKVEISLFDRQLLIAIDGEIMPNGQCPATDSEINANDSSHITHHSSLATERTPFAIWVSENSGLSQSEQEVAVNRQVGNLCVWRDVYYISGYRLQASANSHELPSPKSEARSPKPRTVPAGCYYLLGDNSSFSADSRQWIEPFVAHRYIVGIVHPVPGVASN